MKTLLHEFDGKYYPPANFFILPFVAISRLKGMRCLPLPNLNELCTSTVYTLYMT